MKENMKKMKKERKLYKSLEREGKNNRTDIINKIETYQKKVTTEIYILKKRQRIKSSQVKKDKNMLEKKN